MRKKILITGGSGLLGVSWALSMRDQYSITLGLHDRSVSIKGVDVRTVDLESAASLTRLFDEVSPDVVIHAAGLTSVEKCQSEPLLAKHINISLTANVAEATNRCGVKFIFISTDHLFSGKEAMVDENHVCQPVNVYGLTKCQAELEAFRQNPRSLIIRTNFYGWGTSYRKSFSDMIIDALRANIPVTLFKDVYYTPILAEELIDVVHELNALDALGVYNVCGDERISKYDFGIALAKRFSLNEKLIVGGLISDVPSLVNRPLDMSLSNDKTTQLLGRRLGQVSQHIEKLYAQELSGYREEVRRI